MKFNAYLEYFKLSILPPLPRQEKYICDTNRLLDDSVSCQVVCFYCDGSESRTNSYFRQSRKKSNRLDITNLRHNYQCFLS